MMVHGRMIIGAHENAAFSFSLKRIPAQPARWRPPPQTTGQPRRRRETNKDSGGTAKRLVLWNPASHHPPVRKSKLTPAITNPTTALMRSSASNPIDPGVGRGFEPALLVLVALLTSLLFAGCAHRPINAKLEYYSPTNGYYFHTQMRPDNSDDTLFILAFSGGGTRAAAFSYGVLEELRRTTIPHGDTPRRLLDEVDAISSVSGGSVTAAAYALYGDRVFSTYETNFLKRNVQSTLLWRTLNPLHWGRLWSSSYGRSDLAAEYYDEILFGGATFADLQKQPGPYVVLNATDISTGARFDFTQYQFNLISSDLSPYSVARAVAASSAVPALLTPITLNNYAGSSDYQPPAWLFLGGTNLTSRERFHARELRELLNSTNRPYLHLVDGGVSDNLGLRAVLDGIMNIRKDPELAKYHNFGKLTRVVLINVNAFSSPDKDWDRRESPPGTIQLALASATITMDRYSYETIEHFREQVDHWRDRVNGSNGAAGVPSGASNTPRREIKFYPILINFTNIKDKDMRRYYLNLPTSFALPSKDVDNLRDAGGRLLRQSETYQEFLRDLGVPRDGS